MLTLVYYYPDIVLTKKLILCQKSDIIRTYEHLTHRLNVIVNRSQG